MFALEPQETLLEKDRFTAAAPFTSAPFSSSTKREGAWWSRRTRTAACKFSIAPHSGVPPQDPLHKTMPFGGTGADGPGLATWLDSAGTRWIAATTPGPVEASANLGTRNGDVATGAVVAFTVVDSDGQPALKPQWVSPDIKTPLTPAVINGVVFAVTGAKIRSRIRDDGPRRRRCARRAPCCTRSTAQQARRCGPVERRSQLQSVAPDHPVETARCMWLRKTEPSTRSGCLPSGDGKDVTSTSQARVSSRSRSTPVRSVMKRTLVVVAIVLCCSATRHSGFWPASATVAAQSGAALLTTGRQTAATTSAPAGTRKSERSRRANVANLKLLWKLQTGNQLARCTR